MPPDRHQHPLILALPLAALAVEESCPASLVSTALGTLVVQQVVLDPLLACLGIAPEALFALGTPYLTLTRGVPNLHLHPLRQKLDLLLTVLHRRMLNCQKYRPRPGGSPRRVPLHTVQSL